jgi:serine protease Do
VRLLSPTSSLLRLAVAAFALLSARDACANTLTIASNPSRATVEIDGVVVGTTPYEAKFPGGYFHKTHTVFGQRLERRMVARVSKEGYATKEIELTYGPIPWIALNGHHHGSYWLFKSDHFEVRLEPISKVLTGKIETSSGAMTQASLWPLLSTEQIVEASSPAVVLLQRSDGSSGTGFFVTDTGVIATNAHVAEGESTLLAVAQSKVEWPAKVVFIDSDLDVALLKVDASGLPHLRLAELSTIRTGQTVIAIGNPTRGLPNSVTKGIVSAVGEEKNHSGTWVQTDAAINPGNSGGPLLNTSGEVIGITTRKEFSEQGSEGRPLQGIGFALSASDLIRVLERFYPNAVASNETSRPNGTGTVSITSDPASAEIYVDGKFAGNTPSTFELPAGPHHIEVRSAGKRAWERDLEVLKNSQVTLHPVLEQRE